MSDSVCPICGRGVGRNVPKASCASCERGLIQYAARELEVASEDQAEVDDFGDYELFEEIGRGGMAVVYRARQRSLGRMVAIKMILHGRLASSVYRDRLRAEAAAAASLRHPHIVTIYEVGEYLGQAFLAMELVSGRTLADLARETPLSPSRAARYLQLVARAIQAAHDQQVLHRDLKPANVILDDADQPRVTDFGLARRLDHDSEITLAGAALGTPGFLPPEQVAVSREAVGPWSDIYSLGATLYFLLTTRAPFLGETVASTLQQVLHDDPISPRRINPAVPRDLETICLKCLEKSPDKRYRSASALAEDLDRFLRNIPITARPTNFIEKAWRWRCRRPALATLLAGTVLAVLVSLGAVTWQWRRAAAADARTAAALRGTQLRLAEMNFQKDDVSSAIGALARAVRANPSDPYAVRRLYSALDQRAFALPVGPRLHPGTNVWSADLSANECWMVTTTETPEAFVWDVRQVRGALSASSLVAPTLVLRHPGRVLSARISPDARYVVTACVDRRLRWWDRTTGAVKGSQLECEKEIFAICFRPDGNEIAAADVDGGVIVWNGEDSAARWRFPSTADAEQGFVSSGGCGVKRIHDRAPLAYNRDGTRLVSGVNSGTLRCWNMASGVLDSAFAHGGLIVSAEFNSNDTTLLAASRDRAFRIWDRARQKALVSPTWSPTAPVQVHFNPGGTRVATGFYNHQVIVWDARTGNPVAPPLQHRGYVEDTCFSPDGRWLIVAGHDGTATIWDVQTGRQLVEPVRASASLRSARFLADARTFRTRGTTGVQFWKLSMAEPVFRPFGDGSNEVLAVRFAPGGRQLIAVNQAHDVSLWDARSGRQVPSPSVTVGNHFVEVELGAFLAKAQVAAAAAWEQESGLRLADFARPKGKFHSFDVSRDGRHIAVGLGEGGGRWFDVAAGVGSGRDLAEPARIVSLEFAPDGRQLASASTDRAVRLWSMASGAQVGPALPHPGEVVRVHWSADGRRLVSFGYFEGAFLWDLRATNAAPKYLGHQGEVFDAHFDPASVRVVTAGADWVARIWDVETGRPLGPPLPHGREVRSAVFCQDGESVMTAAGDGQARLWDAQEKLPLTEPFVHPSHLNSLELSDDGRAFVCVGGSGVARLWEFDRPPLPCPAWLPDLAEALMGARSSGAELTEPLPPEAFPRLAERLRSLGTNDFYSRWFSRRFPVQ